MYGDIFKIDSRALEKYNEEQLIYINQAVRLIKQRIETAEVQLVKKGMTGKRREDKLAKFYRAAVSEALEIVPISVLMDITCDDEIIGGGNGLTHREYLRFQYLSEERNQNIKASKIACAKIFANYALDVTFASFGVMAEDIEDEKLRNLAEFADESEAVEYLKFESIYDADKVRGMKAIICKNEKLFAPPAPLNPDVPPRKKINTGKEYGAMTLDEIDDLFEDLLKP